MIGDVTAHGVGHWALFHDGDRCQIWALALVTSHQVEAEGSWMAHVASVVALVDVDASSDAHAITAVALWAGAGVVVLADWHAAGQRMALGWSAASLVEDAVK